MFKSEIDARFAAMAFYGAIEQLLTGWIFGLLPQGEEHFERAKWLVVETVCGGLQTAAGTSAAPLSGHDGPPASRMENEMVKRLMWSGAAGGHAARSRASSPTASRRIALAAAVRRGAAGVSAQFPRRRSSDEQPQNIATAIAEVSERATLLVREEIELAKAEVTEKATSSPRARSSASSPACSS